MLSDIDQLVALANNKNVSRYLIDTFPFPYTKQDAQWWITAGAKANESVTKVIEYQGQFVGSVGFNPQPGWKNHQAEIGYWIGEAYWGTGIATQALRILSDFAFATGGYHKLFAPVLAPNKASMRVADKCGYTLEAILKQEVMKDGQYFNVYHYTKYKP